MTSLVLRSPAKINLGLWVGGRRSDGYHDLVTIIAPLEFADRVAIKQSASGIRVTTDGRQVPAGRGNIAHRAAESFYAAVGIRPGCRIHVHKKIPVGGGLGGGSSNAATVLLGLNRLYGEPLSHRQLVRIGATLGSDVPAFLAGGTCVVRGRGERLRRVRLPRLEVLLYVPRDPVSTAWAYAELDRLRRAELTVSAFSPKMLCLHLRKNELGKAAVRLANSFEPVVFARHPNLARARDLFVRHGAYAASLSGSGSTVYGLVRPQGWKDPMAAMARHGFPCIRTSTN